MCDIGTAISAGLQILTSDSGGGSGGSSQAYANSDAASQAALRGIQLQEQQYADEMPYRKANIAAGVEALGRSEKLAAKQLPLQLTVIDEAVAAGSAWEQEQAAGRAAADTHAAIDATGGSRARTLASLGIKPGDAAYTAGAREGDASNAATLAKAATDARDAERVRGIATRQKVAGAAMPVYNPNVPMSNASSITSAASGLASSQGTLGTTLYNQEQEQLGSLGKAAGTIMDRVFKPSAPTLPAFDSGEYASRVGQLGGGDAWFADGGPVRSLKFAAGDIVDAEIVDGHVRGPGGPTDDAVPALVDGQEPAALSSGEFVIKAAAVEKYGPRLLREVNEGTAIVIPTKSPRRLKMVA